MRAFVGLTACAGGVNSLRKQNNPETQLTASTLTNRGLENMQKCFIALLGSGGMCCTGFFMGCIANDMRNGAVATRIVGLSSMAMLTMGVVTPIYSAFKAGEGMVDLCQSPPALRNNPSPKL